MLGKRYFLELAGGLRGKDLHGMRKEHIMNIYCFCMPENLVTSDLTSFDPDSQAAGQPDRFAHARDAAIQSFRNRLGRDPSTTELRDWMPAYLTAADRVVYERELPERQPYLARGFPTLPRPMRRVAPPVPPPLSGYGSPRRDLGQAGSTGIGPYVDAIVKTLQFGVLAKNLPRDIVAEAVLSNLLSNRDKNKRWQDFLSVRRLEGASEAALAAQVNAYDRYKSDPDYSYQTYTKKRQDPGPCRYSQKVSPLLPCYYAGSTSGDLDAWRNVEDRDSANDLSP